MQNHLEEDGLDFSTVFPFLFFHRGVKNVFGRNLCIGNALVVAQHPDINVWNTVLRLRTYDAKVLTSIYTSYFILLYFSILIN